MRRARLAPLLLPLLLVALAACGSAPADAPAAAPSSASDGNAAPEQTERPKSSAPTATGEAPEILRFTAQTVDDERFEGAELAGRPALLWFWAPWCPVCRSQVPLVEDLAARYGDDLGVVGVGSLDSAEAIASFADDTSGITQLTDPGGELWRRFGIVEQSSFVVLDGAGREVLRSGYANDDGVRDAVDGLMG